MVGLAAYRVGLGALVSASLIAYGILLLEGASTKREGAEQRQQKGEKREGRAAGGGHVFLWAQVRTGYFNKRRFSEIFCPVFARIGALVEFQCKKVHENICQTISHDLSSPSFQCFLLEMIDDQVSDR